MAPLVEARRDGRVGERESASLDRHLLACTSCRELASDLERLAGLAGRPAVGALSPLEQRRERLRLLRDAAFTPASLVGTRSRVQLVRFAAAAAMIFGVLAGGTALAILALPSAKADPQAAPSSPGSSTTVPPAAPRTLVATIAEPVVVAAPPSAEAVAEAASPPVVAPRPAAPRRQSPASTPSARPSDAAKPSEGASALADGVELIERGDYGAAADRLGAFRQSHPGDARAQDAAFLAILALDRAGRHPAAVAAARDYLTSYPRGYRRAEARAIVAAQ